MSFRVFARFKELRGGNTSDRADAGLTAHFPDERTVETSYLRRTDQNFSFSLDRVFPPGSSNSEVYEQCAQAVVQHACSGQNSIVFAYGHAGSGKEATMFGDSSQPGLLLSSILHLFGRGVTSASVTAVDVFKETLRDLLKAGGSNVGAGSLKLRDSATGTIVDGASEITLHSPADIESCMDQLKSCRGHCVVTIRLPQGTKLFLVALADTDLGSTGKTASAEAAEIRKWQLKSFTALGNCLKAVSDRAKMVPVACHLITSDVGGMHPLDARS